MSTSRSFEFEVHHKKNGMIIEKKSYHFTTEDYLMGLRKKQERGEIALFCCCSNNIEMRISKKPHIYPAKRDLGHSTNCVRNPRYEGSGDYEKAWVYDEEKGEHVVRVEAMIPSTEDKKSENQTNENRNKIYIEYSTSKRKGEATVFGLASKLNMMAWQNMVLGKKAKLPEDAFELAKYVYGVSNHVRLANKRNPLSDMFHKPVNIRDVQVQKDIFYIYMYYNDKRRGDTDKLFNGTVKDIVYGKNSFKQEYGFYIDIQEFERKLSKESHSNNFVMSGFAYKSFKYDKKLTLGTYCLIPISEKGLFVESFYEKEVFDTLCTQQRPFYKPYLPIEEYKGFIPDLIIDEVNKKTIVGEIFGIKNDEEYERKREEKIVLSEKDEFKAIYDFWKWDANKGESLILPK
ncbi:hypothetical protein ACFVSS_24800 [Peribacillus butanolivorans]|uniref:hypothetical protein n=1 Tax=Peribacillus butanolivorans TaxID=421767 RepID=UPI0036DA0A22